MSSPAGQISHRGRVKAGPPGPLVLALTRRRQWEIRRLATRGVWMVDNFRIVNRAEKRAPGAENPRGGRRKRAAKSSTLSVGAAAPWNKPGALSPPGGGESGERGRRANRHGMRRPQSSHAPRGPRDPRGGPGPTGPGRLGPLGGSPRLFRLGRLAHGRTAKWRALAPGSRPGPWARSSWP